MDKTGAAIDGSEFLRTCVECKKWFTIEAGQGLLLYFSAEKALA